MATGTIAFFHDTYGFISTDDANDKDDDVFFHMREVSESDLEEGQDIEFDIKQGPSGPRATNVLHN